MHTHWHNLIVKEWHAHKWKFASLAAVLLVVHTWILVDATLTGFDSLSNSQEAFTLLTVTSFFCAIPGALFVGMGVAAGERSAGTFAFMRALPAAPWKVAATKLLMASVTVVAPVAGVASSAVWFGVVVGLVVGIGTFVAELQPDLLTFWRSRPISPSLWFWTKYLTGASIILIFLDGPIVLAVGLAAGGWVDVDLVGVVPLVGFLSCAPLLHLLAFSCAVLLVCVVREAVYAGILAVGLLAVVLLSPELVAGLEWLSPQHVMVLMERSPLVELAGVYLPFFGVMLGLSLVATLLAWQAVVRDISIKP